MGLTSKANVGVKAQLRSRFPRAFKNCDSLADARDAASAAREQAIAVIDGNVLIMAVPQRARTYDDYVAVLMSSLKQAIATALVTVVVFDEPDSLTKAKIQEQMKRDHSRASASVACSQDLVRVPTTDAYSKRDIEAADDVQALVRHRPTRQRFIDEVAMDVLKKLTAQIDRWSLSGHTGGHLLFDGIDPRGADRPFSEKRDPQVVGSSDEAVAAFRRETKIGEGDLKLAWHGRGARAGALQDGLLANLKLNMAVTIDTDSFAIELIEEARRAADANVSPCNTVLCMRERAQKRGREDDREAHYLCCDVALLHDQVQRHMWGISASPSPLEQRAAMTLMVGGWVLCGCDYVDAVKPLRADVVFEAVPEVVRRPATLARMQAAWAGDRAALQQLERPLQELMTTCCIRLSDMPKVRKTNLLALRSVDSSVLKRASWVAAYWNSVEHSGNLEDCGFFIPYSQ